MEHAATAVVALALLLTAGAPTVGPGHAPPLAPWTGAALRNPALASRPAVIDPEGAGATGRLEVQTQDPAVVPNTGLRTNITAFSAQALPADTSFQISATETIGAYDAVFGIFENNATYPVAFFFVFNSTTDHPVLQGEWASLPLLDGEPYDFELVAVNATSWELTVNGLEFDDNSSLAFFDFGTGAATWAGGILFTEIAFYVTTDPVPAFVNVPLALAVRNAQGWYLPTSGNTTFVGAGGNPWGIEGQEQHPTLAPGEVDTGTSLAPVPNGTALWSGGPAPVRVGIALSNSSAVATTPFFLTVTVDDTLGAPIPGVSVFVGDALGGTSLVTFLVTDGSGNVEDALELPNVSASASDLIEATVTLFGYEGSAGVAVEVTPAPQVFLVTSGLPGAVAPGSTVEFTITAEDAEGGSVTGASLLVTTTTAGGDVTPSSGVTGSGGTLGAELLAPPSPVVMVILVNVTGGGAWGHAVFTVDVRTPAPSPWSVYGGWVELGAGVVVGLLVAAFVVAQMRARRKRRLPPSYGIRWGAPTAGPPRPERGGVPPTRRPPSGGAP